MSEELYKQMAQSIIDGDSDISTELAKKSIEVNMHPLDAITNGFVVGVTYIGDQFGKGEAFLPELVMAGEAMKAAIAVLEPELLKLGETREMLGRVVLATVEGDIHEIGKTLVGTMLSASGFEVFDLGVDQPAEKIIGKALETAYRHHIDLTDPITDVPTIRALKRILTDYEPMREWAAGAIAAYVEGGCEESRLAAWRWHLQRLLGSIGGATGGVTTNGGSFNALAPGSSNGSELSVGISTASAANSCG